MKIRKVKKEDRDEWARIRNELWPESPEEHLNEIDHFFSHREDNDQEVYVLSRESGKLGGFIELRIRNYAEGTSSPEVPYLEAWYVDPDLRGKGYGEKLMSTAEQWALEKGFNELASDTEIDNELSMKIHKKLGFKEVDRIVCFLKKLE